MLCLVGMLLLLKDPIYSFFKRIFKKVSFPTLYRHDLSSHVLQIDIRHAFALHLSLNGLQQFSHETSGDVICFHFNVNIYIYVEYVFKRMGFSFVKKPNFNILTKSSFNNTLKVFYEGLKHVCRCQIVIWILTINTK